MADAALFKKALKQWETEFWKENGRKPNKADIDSAPDRIKETYVKYTKLKKTAPTPKKEMIEGDKSNTENTIHKVSNTSIESSDQNVLNKDKREIIKETTAPNERETISDGAVLDNSKENMDVGDETDNADKIEVWGSQFDRKVASTNNDTEVENSKKEENKPSFLNKLGQKMFQQSLKLNKAQMMKQNTRQWKKPDTPRPVKPYKPDTELCDRLDGQGVKTIDSHDEVDGSPNPEVPKHANFGKVFEKALLITKQKEKAQCPEESGSDLYMNKYMTKAKPKQSFLPVNLSNLISKQRKELVIEEEQFDIDEFNLNDQTDHHHVDNDDQDDQVDVAGGHSWHVPVSKLIRDDENEAMKKSKKSVKKEVKNESKKTANKKYHVKDFEDDVETNSINKDKGDIGKDAKGLREAEPQKDILDSIEGDKDKENNLDTLDYTNCSEDESPKPKPKRRAAAKSTKATTVTNARKASKKRVIESDEEFEKPAENSGDSDVEEKGDKKKKAAGKAQPAAKKRKTNAGTVAVNDEGQVASTSVAKKPTRTKAVSNDNFIRLNMKIKTYKRKGRHMTGPQFKRKMWKEKMQARSKSYGDACFKCGQSGHWANKCTGMQSTNKYDKEPVLDEDFPSMQEAAMMAKGCPIKRPAKSETKKSEMQEKNASGDGTEIPHLPGMPAVEEDIDLDIQSGIVRSRKEAVTAPPAMEPLIQCGEGEDIPETPEFVLKGLRKFGFDSFRQGQEEAVMRILCGLSTLVVLSTGGGKSLCYQLPAYLYSKRSTCITLVISPLVSLMEDQVTGLPNGIQGVCLHTNMTAHQRENVLESVKSGKAQFLLVSPEAIAGGSMSLIASMASLPPVAFVCIDEAHCLSEWSHNFRPSYLRLCKVLQEKLGVQNFLGLTATATLSTASDVARHLKISDFRKATVRGSPIPKNLILSVSRDEDREQALIGLLQGERFGKLESIIIYCTRRDQTDKVATIIRTCMNTGAPTEVIKKGRSKRPKLEWDAESYHAGLTPAQRKRVQNNFMTGKLRVVVATVAFGMGLDKSDVRGVIHYNMPKSFESYVQEIGRAGRDGERADCHVFLDPEGKDLCELRRHTYANTVDYRTLKKLVQKVFPQCRCRDVHERHAQAKLEAEMFDDDFDMETEEQSSEADKENKNTSDKSQEESQDARKETDETLPAAKARLCPGHERALPIQQTVMDLDVKEEGISTLLCYLELHDSQWLENMSNVYATCKVQCYGGPNQLQNVAKKCPPVAVAIASARKDGKSFTNTNSIEFDVVEVSDTMGWDSGPVKKELKLLQWNFDSGGPKRTGVMVEFSDLAYHFRTPGDFTTDELDSILQFMHERIQRQEKSEIRNLSNLYQALKSVSHRNNYLCSDEADISKNDKLKVILNKYFDQQLINEEEDDESEVQEEPGKDLCELRRHTYANTVDYRTLKKLVQKVFPQCRCRDVHERHAQAKLEAEMFDDDFVMETEEQSSVADKENKNTSDKSQKEAKDPRKETDETLSGDKARLCPVHERALPIQQTVMDLDVKEEGISTLLCYLELHDSQWLENMSNVYATCKVQCYGDPNQLQNVAKKCPPVAVAIASARKDGKSFTNTNSIKFDVVEVSDTMGWDSGPVKKELKLLQWNFDSGGPKRTGVMVEFSDLAYHFRTPGDFTTDELDSILQFMHERIQRQEKSEIRYLSNLYQALKSVSHRNNYMCSDEADISKNDKLKIPDFYRGQLLSDIRGFYNFYGQDHSLNGRAIARIFHGISSPCFPATTWGRVRRFWRSHLNVDFNTLMKMATKELISFR